MAYTPSGRQSEIGTTNFGTLREDGNHRDLSFGNVFQTRDAAAVPIGSPVTFATTQTLTVPPNAIQVLITSTTNAVQISEDSTGSVYFTLPAGNPQWFDCADQQFIYLVVGSSTVVSFLFKLV